MSYIDDHYELISLEANLLDRIFHDLELPIPESRTISFDQARFLLRNEHDVTVEGGDLNAEQERLIGEFYLKEGIDLVFITGYADDVRPFYAMPGKTFDLLYKGVEITSGGQRIHDYNQLVERMTARGMNVEDFSDYLQTFKYGMPPHGGFGLGLERLTWLILGLGNVKEACLFPRDKHRLRP